MHLTKVRSSRSRNFSFWAKSQFSRPSGSAASGPNEVAFRSEAFEGLMGLAADRGTRASRIIWQAVLVVRFYAALRTCHG